MTINLYLDLLNGLLIRSGHARTGYMTANRYYLDGDTVGDACSATLLTRARRMAMADAGTQDGDG